MKNGAAPALMCEGGGEGWSGGSDERGQRVVRASGSRSRVGGLRARAIGLGFFSLVNLRRFYFVDFFHLFFLGATGG